MANEGKASASLYWKSGTNELPVRSKTIEFDVAGDQPSEIVQTIGTSEETITMPTDTASGGYCFFENRDTTNYISIRQGTGTTDMIQLLAGEIALFRLHPDTTAPYGIADTAACDLLVRRLDL